MANTKINRWAALVLFACLVSAPVAYATRLPVDLKAKLAKLFPESKVRLDGAIETKGGNLYLPLVPTAKQEAKPPEIRLNGVFPSRSEPVLLSFSNGWFFLKVQKLGKNKTVAVPANLPEALNKSLLSCRFPADFIVPEGFILPRALKPTVGEQPIAFEGEKPKVVEKPPEHHEAPPPKKVVHTSENSHEGLFVTSPRSGKITLLEPNGFTKLAEFPTEGTPGGLAYAEGKLYITDQSKHRVLKLDPDRQRFVGQINLPEYSAPKGVAALPNGKLLYVSESGSGNIAVFETESDRLLVRTKVLSGPARMAITPDGNYLIVLNTPAGKITIISTRNQRVMATVLVGTMPNQVEISADSQRAYISNRVSNSVSVVDILKHQVVETLKTGAGPTGLTLDDTGDRLFVANAKDNTIGVFDLKAHKKLDDIKLPLDVDFPGALTLMPNKQRILVSSESTEAIGLLDTNTLAFEKQPVIGHPSDEFLLVPLINQ